MYGETVIYLIIHMGLEKVVPKSRNNSYLCVECLLMVSGHFSPKD